MNKKDKGRSFIPQFQPNQPKPTKYINTDAVLLNSWQKDGDNANVLLSIRFIQDDFQCFSQWNRNEMKAFWSFSEKIHLSSWSDVYRSGGKREKTGFGYTVIEVDQYPDSDFKGKLDPYITLFELRVSEKARVHCFRDNSLCYICWLDKDHEICK